MRKRRASLRLIISFMWPAFAHCGSAPIPHEIPVAPYSGQTDHWPIKGKILEAKTWLEDGDSSVLIISHIQQAENCEKDHKSALFGYRFDKKSGHWTKAWEIKEYNQNICESMQYEDSTLQVVDVDARRPAETIFFYSVARDGADPISMKMMFHLNGVKAPIRGKIPWTQEDIAFYEMNLDPQLKTASKGIRDYAVGCWKRFVTKNFGSVVKLP